MAADDCSSEAALIATTLGRPVRLQWMRADEHGWDPKGPPVLLDYRAEIDSEGRITSWESDIFLSERPMQRSGATLLAAVLANLPKFGSGPGTYNAGLGIPYALHQQPADRALAHGHAATRGLDTRAGSPAEYLRQRKLP